MNEEIEKLEIQLAEKQKEDNNAINLVKQQEKELLNTAEVKSVANRIGLEKIHSDFEEQTAKIEKKNVENKQQLFDNKKKKRKIDREEAEEELEHKYKMQEIKKNAEHKRMLDTRKKLVEKYGYLYDSKEFTTAHDSEDKEYKVPKDFSYSEWVNKIRQFGRNISKLDRPVLQTIKWLIIGGIIFGAVLILKKFNII